MNGFLTKPVTAERLRAVLEQIPPGYLLPAAAPGVSEAALSPLEPFPPAPPMCEPALLDEAFLRQLVDDISMEGAIEVMRAFLEEGPPRLEAIQDAMARDAIPVVRREAHALAGAARNVGLTRLGDAAYALQKATELSGPEAASIEALAVLLRDTLPLVVAWTQAREEMALSGG